MSTGSLGIVVPTFNASATLPQTLASLRPAVDAGAKVLVVDGGSEDQTPAIVREEGFPITTVRGNMYTAINAGMRELCTEWLTWINADDLLYCHQLNGRIKAAGSSDVAYGPVDFIDLEGRYVHTWGSAFTNDLRVLYRAGYSPLLQQGTIFRRSVFLAINGFREQFRLVGDADFWWRALDAGVAFKRSRYPSVAAFRLHPGQLSQRYAVEMHEEHSRLLHEHGGTRRSFLSLMALSRFRGANLGRYVVRTLRRYDLDGRLVLPRSYDLYKCKEVGS